MNDNLKVGVFDSGLGGLSVVKEIINKLKYIDIIYIADTLHVPYGDKTYLQLKEYVYDIIKFFKYIEKLDIIVMACNTSSSLILPKAKIDFADITFLGVVDFSVVNSIQKTKNGKIGVIANKATTKSNIFKEKINLLDNQVKVYQKACPLLVPLIENGQINTKQSYKVLHKYLSPLKEKNIDTLILGCTHYPFLKDQINTILENKVEIIDPANYLAKSLKDIIERKIIDLNYIIDKNKQGLYQFYLTKYNQKFELLAKKFLNFSYIKAYPLNIKEALKFEKVR